MKNLKKLDFYGEAYQGQEFPDRTEFYQYAIRDGKTYKVVWLYDKEYLDTIDSMDEIPFSLEDIDSVEEVEED